MTLDSLALAATIILLFPMGYMLLGSPAFLLVRFSIPVVPRLLRAMFYGYFIMMMITGGFATLAYAVSGRIGPAIGMALITACAVIGRRWFLGNMDNALNARDAGDENAVRRLRHLHVGGMLFNMIQLAAVIYSVPQIV